MPPFYIPPSFLLVYGASGCNFQKIFAKCSENAVKRLRCWVLEVKGRVKNRREGVIKVRVLQVVGFG
jgi:hypothetical protein